MAQYQVHAADGSPPVASAYLSDPLAGEASRSGVSWGAIFAGAAGAASLSLVLLLLGTGLGMSSVSPWSNEGASATTIGIATILWLSFTQLAASGMGGYLAGRLRTKWSGLHTDEVYFRDTAHGFLAWSVATLLMAGLMTSVVGNIVGAGAKAGATVAGGAVAATAAGAGAGVAASQAGGRGDDASPGATGYFVDALFRPQSGTSTAAAPAPSTAPAPAAEASAAAAPTTGTLQEPPATPPSTASATPSSSSTAMTSPERSPAAVNAEVTRIFLNSLRTGALPADDRTYVAQLVAQRTGMSQAEAEKRVTDTYAKAQAALKDTQAKAQEAADTARKASAWTAMWLVVSLLVGAFVASFAATFGGRRRDL